MTTFNNTHAIVSSPNSIRLALKSLLDDDELSDLQIQSTYNDENNTNDDDDTPSMIPAVRAILATRSPVFRRMLYGNFSESTCSTIKLPYRSDVIRYLVEFCYTDDCHGLQLLPDGDDNNNNDNTEPSSGNDQWDEQKLRTMVDLIVAADYFELTSLSDKATNTLLSLLEKKPNTTACVILDQSQTSGGGESLTSLIDAAMMAIRKNPSGTLLPTGVLALSELTLPVVISEDGMVADETTMFLALQTWVGGGSSSTLPSSSPRFSIAQRIAATSLRPAAIPPSTLSTIVSESGLLPPSVMMDAYKQQALILERHITTPPTPTSSSSSTAPSSTAYHHLVSSSLLSPLRRLPWWTTTKQSLYTSTCPHHATEFLDCHLMTCGKIYRWSLRIVEYCAYVWVGVACGTGQLRPREDEWLGRQRGGWAYGSNGVACHDDQRERDGLPMFRGGSVVTMELDLSGGGGGGMMTKGVLSACVDDGEMMLLFGDIEVGSGFVPAVCLKSPGSVKIVRFGVASNKGGGRKNVYKNSSRRKVNVPLSEQYSL